MNCIHDFLDLRASYFEKKKINSWTYFIFLFVYFNCRLYFHSYFVSSFSFVIKKPTAEFNLSSPLYSLNFNYNFYFLFSGLFLLGFLATQSSAQVRPPNFSPDAIPETSFTCEDKITGGYYADQEADCQLFHVCVQVSEYEVWIIYQFFWKISHFTPLNFGGLCSA